MTLELDAMDEAMRVDFGKLFVVEQLHRRGPTSMVHIARDLESGRRVALKVIPRSPVARGDVEQEFRQGVAAAAAHNHAHVVPIYGSGTTDHFFWYSMEYVDAPSLAELLSLCGPMELRACLRLVEQVGSALDRGHHRGIVHADLKPANVLIDASGWARVTDFWIPWVLDQLGAFAAAGGRTRQAEYLAPEEVSTRPPDSRADQYSLAILVYECLSGKVPFSGGTVDAIAAAHRTEAPPPLRDLHLSIPPHVSLAVERALNKAPGSRFANIPDFITALETPKSAPMTRPAPVASPTVQQYLQALSSGAVAGALPEAPSPPRRRRWVPLGALAVAILGVAGSVAVLNSWWMPAPAIATSPPPMATSPPDSTGGRLDTVGPVPPELGASPPPALDLAPRPERARPGRLFINATPWGLVSVDGVPIGNTPRVDVPIPPGVHQLRVVREGFEAFEQTIHVAPGRQVRLTDIVLRERKP